MSGNKDWLNEPTPRQRGKERAIQGACLIGIGVACWWLLGQIGLISWLVFGLLIVGVFRFLAGVITLLTGME